jgi:hypothetical protein
MDTEPGSSPAAVPPPTATIAATQATLPTLGATVGAAVGQLVAAKVGGGDPLIGNTIAVVTSAAFTALFHWVSTKLHLML